MTGFLRRVLSPYRGLLILVILLQLGQSFLTMYLPTINSRVIDYGVANADAAYIMHQGILMLGIALIQLLLSTLAGIFGAKVALMTGRDLREQVYEKLIHFSRRMIGSMGAPTLITRATNDVQQVIQFITFLFTAIIAAPMMFIVSLYMVVRTSPSLGWYVLGSLPFLLGGVVAIAVYSEPISKMQQKNLDRINGILRENLSGLRVIRAFVNERFEEKRFEEVNDAYATSSKKLFRLMSVAQPAFFFLFNIVMVLIIWSGSVQISTGDLRVGDLIAFIEYIFHALFSFMLFATVFMMYPRAAVSAGRIQDVFDAQPLIKDNPNGITTTATKGELVFDHVTFAYPGPSQTPVIRDISFTASPGETVAFIGSTGSGKSTLIQLIPRFYDVSQGHVLIDGSDVREYQLAALRQKIGYIPQKAVLFTGTIADNLRYGKEDATKEQMLRALDIAQATDFVLSLPNGLDTVVSEGGSNFSGGQKQRLAIARAIIRQPEIFIFDDSFSALDYATDARLRERLRAETTESTTLIVAQRVGTIMDADKIIVLNEGDVVGIGTHKELLKNCAIYYDIAASQLSEEELLK